MMSLRLLIFSLYLLLSLLGANDARAEGESDDPIQPQNRWYASSAVGTQIIPTTRLTNAKDNQDFGEINTEATSVSAGYIINPRWRINLEAGNVSGNSIKIDTEQSLRYRSFSAEALYDLPSSTDYRPFIGGGIGYADVRHSIEGGRSANKAEIFWAATAGFQYPISQNLSFNSKVQLQGHPSYQFGDVELAESTHINVSSGVTFKWGAKPAPVVETPRSQCQIKTAYSPVDDVYEVLSSAEDEYIDTVNISTSNVGAINVNKGELTVEGSPPCQGMLTFFEPVSGKFISNGRPIDDKTVLLSVTSLILHLIKGITMKSAS